MTSIKHLDVAREDIRLSSAGGAPFLIAFGTTIGICGVLAFWLSPQAAALAAMFQGGLALPVAFALEKRMGHRPMRPGGVPLALASIAGGHFLPYAWLHRTSISVWLGVAVSGGALAVQIMLGAAAYPFVLLWMSACYAAAVPLLIRHARALCPGS